MFTLITYVVDAGLDSYILILLMIIVTLIEQYYPDDIVQLILFVSICVSGLPLDR